MRNLSFVGPALLALSAWGCGGSAPTGGAGAGPAGGAPAARAASVAGGAAWVRNAVGVDVAAAWS